jgi:hypothetical protein
MSEMKRVDSPAAWRGPDVDYRMEMMHSFSPEEIAELRAALEHCADADISAITRETFPLPTFGDVVEKYRSDLYTGSGVLLMRGLDAAGFTEDEMARVYVGIASYMGTPVAQSWQGELLGNIIDVSDVKDKIRGYNFGGGQNFHTDGTACDIVSLLCLRTALSGGASRIVSAVALHNAMLEQRPDLLEVLYKGYIYRYGEWDGKDIPAPMQTDHRIPVFARSDVGVCCVQETSHIRNAANEGGVPLSSVESEAFNELQRLAKSDEFYLDMNFQKGDMQFLNNRVILHGRTDYDDPEEVSQRRHMLRLWLNVPEWPGRPDNQIFADRAVVDAWLKRRTTGMDFPSAYLAEVARMQQERLNTNTVLPKMKGNLNAAEWSKPAN